MRCHSSLCRRSQKRGSRSGVAATEMAIVAMLLALLLSAAADWGSAFIVRHHMMQATREATRLRALADMTSQEAIARANAYLTTYYPQGIRDNLFKITSGDGGPSSDECWVEIRIRFADAAIFGGWSMPRDGEMVTRLAMREEE